MSPKMWFSSTEKRNVPCFTGNTNRTEGKIHKIPESASYLTEYKLKRTMNAQHIFIQSRC
jgi:hypothetical protein